MGVKFDARPSFLPRLLRRPMGRHDGVPDVLLDARTRRGGAGLWEIHGGAPTPPSPTASAPPALRAGSASGGRGLSFGACGAFAPLAGPSPAPAADAAGRVKSRRLD